MDLIELMQYSKVEESLFRFSFVITKFVLQLVQIKSCKKENKEQMCKCLFVYFSFSG